MLKCPSPCLTIPLPNCPALSQHQPSAPNICLTLHVQLSVPLPPFAPLSASFQALFHFSTLPFYVLQCGREKLWKGWIISHTHTCAPVSLRIGNAFLLVYLPVTEDAIYTRKPCLMTSSWADVREAMPGRAIPMISEKLQCTLKAQISHRTEYNYSRLAHNGAHSVIRVRTRRRISE